MSLRLPVLYEDNHLLIVDKPAGLVTQGAGEGEDSVVVRAKDYIRERYKKPGNVFLGVVSRLDASVTGVLPLARTSKGAERLNAQYRENTVEKTYLAVVEKTPQRAMQDCVDWMRKEESLQRMVVCSPHHAGAQEARLSYRLIAPLGNGRALLAVRLESGRKHQIRLQLSSRGMSILGDRKYGGTQSFSPGIGLHARRLVLEHPTSKQRLTFIAALPKSWQKLGIDEQDLQQFEES